MPASGPFPSNWFTLKDGTQNTGLRVNLPLPDPATHPSDYQDTQVINTLDGFNLQPRLSVPFDGPIDVNTVNSNTVFLVSLGDTLDPSQHQGEVVGINQVVWDVASNTLHVESNDLLEQHTRYALIVTDGVHDLNGQPVQASEAFQDFRHEVTGDYKHDLLDAIHAARDVGVRKQDIVTASVFTTESATAILEKIRDQIHAGTPAPADFNLGPNRERTVFGRANMTSIRWEQQTGDNPPSFTPTNLPLSSLDIFPGAVGEIAFGKYLSPDYEVHPGEYIPAVGTRTGTPEVQGYNEVYFNLLLPAGPKPEGGWPVALFVNGNGRNKNTAILGFSASMAAQGIAALFINAVGHGFGPLGALTVNQTVGAPVTFPAGGRGIDQDGDHVIENNEGVAATAPRAIISRRDGIRQTAADLMQLVREIQVGMDVHGDGARDLDPSRIYFFSISFGGNVGAAFLAVEPSVRTGVLNVPGVGSVNKSGALSLTNRPSIGSALAARVPALLDPPGIAEIDGVAFPGPRFNENMPLRDGLPLAVRLEAGTSYAIQSPVINTVAGAMAIQEVFENQQWVTQAGYALAYFPHLRKEPLPGVPAKSVIVQFAKGDMSAPNPATTAMLRAGDLADRATYYRNDLAYAEDQNVPKDPHTFLVGITDSDPLVRAIARGAPEQIATFLASDGTEIIQPEPARFFETPIQGPLPEDLNFIPAGGPRGAAAPTSGSPASAPTRTGLPAGSPAVLGLSPPAQLGGTAAGPGAPLGPPWMSGPGAFSGPFDAPAEDFWAGTAAASIPSPRRPAPSATPVATLPDLAPVDAQRLDQLFAAGLEDGTSFILARSRRNLSSLGNEDGADAVL
jgi:hypothetical protein